MQTFISSFLAWLLPIAANKSKEYLSKLFAIATNASALVETVVVDCIAGKLTVQEGLDVLSIKLDALQVDFLALVALAEIDAEQLPDDLWNAFKSSGLGLLSSTLKLVGIGV